MSTFVIARKLVEERGARGLVLGGTELPLILRDAPDPGVPVLDTTKIQVEAAVDQVLSKP